MTDLAIAITALLGIAYAAMLHRRCKAAEQRVQELEAALAWQRIWTIVSNEQFEE